MNRRTSLPTRLLTLLLAMLTSLTLPVSALDDADEGTLISDCASGWHCDGGASYSKNTSDCTDGNACSVASFRTQFFFFFVSKNSSTRKPFDLTGAKYIEFDLWVDDVNVFRNASDCRMDLGPDTNVDAWNVKVKAADLRSLTLQEGWNHVCLPLSGIDNANYDLTTANVIRFYALGLSDEARQVRIDNMRAVATPTNEEDLPAQTKAEPDYFVPDENATLTGSTLRRPGIIQPTTADDTPDSNAPSDDTTLQTPDAGTARTPVAIPIAIGAAALLLAGLVCAIVIKKKGGARA